MLGDGTRNGTDDGGETNYRQFFRLHFALQLQILHQIQNQFTDFASVLDFGSIHQKARAWVNKPAHVESTGHSNGGYTKIMFGDAGTEVGFHWMRAHSDTLFAREPRSSHRANSLLSLCVVLPWTNGNTLYVQARSLTLIRPS